MNKSLWLLVVLLPALAALQAAAGGSSARRGSMPSVRPPPGNRTFNSTAVNAAIEEVASKMRDPDLATLFSNCLPNSLDTTVSSFNLSAAGPDAFIITGDIDAQWLRDSANQVLPYLQFASQDEPLRLLLCGLVRRQARDVLGDPYANAFNFAEEGGPHQGDQRVPPMTPHVFEGKYELDSLAAFLKLSYGYWNWTGDLSCFASSAEWLPAAQLAVDTVQQQQRGSLAELPNPPYMFQRLTTVATDTLELGGAGPAASGGVGMAKSAFRPSDDATKLPYLVPANAMAAVELEHLAELLGAVGGQQAAGLAAQAQALAVEIRGGIEAHGRLPGGGYAYEVDGYGGFFSADDANIPSLLSLPYLGYCGASDPAYLATRASVLSNATNPYFFSGSAGEGVGGPHEGLGYVWPMSVVVRALTSTDDEEIAACLELIKQSSAGTGLLHESFWMDDVTNYTRPWFAWVNSLFGGLILQLARERPYLIF